MPAISATIDEYLSFYKVSIYLSCVCCSCIYCFNFSFSHSLWNSSNLLCSSSSSSIVCYGIFNKYKKRSMNKYKINVVVGFTLAGLLEDKINTQQQCCKINKGRRWSTRRRDLYSKKIYPFSSSIFRNIILNKSKTTSIITAYLSSNCNSESLPSQQNANPYRVLQTSSTNNNKQNHITIMVQNNAGKGKEWMRKSETIICLVVIVTQM